MHTHWPSDRDHASCLYNVYERVICGFLDGSQMHYSFPQPWITSVLELYRCTWSANTIYVAM